jgi:hypothetical protein
MGRIEPPSVRETETLGQWDVKTETSVVIDCGACVETISSMGCPGGLSGGATYTRAFVPSGARGVLLKSNGP